MIARRNRYHASLARGGGEREHGVQRASRFERSRFLQILALEPEIYANALTKRCRVEERSLMYTCGNARTRGSKAPEREPRAHDGRLWRRVSGRMSENGAVRSGGPETHDRGTLCLRPCWRNFASDGPMRTLNR